jgi:hypothetical protein
MQTVTGYISSYNYSSDFSCSIFSLPDCSVYVFETATTFNVTIIRLKATSHTFCYVQLSNKMSLFYLL